MNQPNKQKRKKPYPDFPLSWHVTGYWYKKIRGKRYYFGPRWAEPHDALADYLSVRDELHAGLVPKAWQDEPDGLTVGSAMAAFIADRESRMANGTLNARTLDGYARTIDRVIELLGATTPIAKLTTKDFSDLKATMSQGVSPVTLKGNIRRTLTAFKFLYDAGLVESPVRVGPTFKCPSRTQLRKHAAQQVPRMFEASEIHTLLASAKVHLKAMILLGVNCGFGNSDCGQVGLSNLDLEHGWHNFGRPKTGVKRRGHLWPETIAALQASIEQRSQPKEENEDLVFVTKYGNSWATGGYDNAVSHEFKKLANDVGIDTVRGRKSFYALRHVFETIGGDSQDQVAVNYIMGHVDPSISATYREGVSDDRLKAVSMVVHKWLFASATTSGDDDSSS